MKYDSEAIDWLKACNGTLSFDTKSQGQMSGKGVVVSAADFEISRPSLVLMAELHRRKVLEKMQD